MKTKTKTNARKIIHIDLKDHEDYSKTPVTIVRGTTTVTEVRMPRLLTIKDFAAMMSINIRTAKRWIEGGAIMTKKIGPRRLIPTSQFEE